MCGGVWRAPEPFNQIRKPFFFQTQLLNVILYFVLDLTTHSERSQTGLKYLFVLCKTR